MSKYYNPTTDVTSGEVGRALVNIPQENPRDAHAAALRELKSNEDLFVACNRLIFWNVVEVNSLEQYLHFWEQYEAGHVLTFHLYALTKEQQQGHVSN